MCVTVTRGILAATMTSPAPPFEHLPVPEKCLYEPQMEEDLDLTPLESLESIDTGDSVDSLFLGNKRVRAQAWSEDEDDSGDDGQPPRKMVFIEDDFHTPPPPPDHRPHDHVANPDMPHLVLEQDTRPYLSPTSRNDDLYIEQFVTSDLICYERYDDCDWSPLTPPVRQRSPTLNNDGMEFI